jgi:hypothetical protein
MCAQIPYLNMIVFKHKQVNSIFFRVSLWKPMLPLNFDELNTKFEKI